MAGLGLIWTVISGSFQEQFDAMQDAVAVAATASIRTAADKLKTAARADIAAAGFSGRWQNALRVNTYPAGGKPAIDAAAYLFHRIGYADIFEEGGNIKGEPLLWLPLRNTPLKIGGQKMTPALYQAQIGPLRYVARGGAPPLLVAEQATTRSKKSGYSLASLRRGAAGSGNTRTVPLFIGLDVVHIGRKFHIADDAKQALETLAGAFADNLKDE